MEKLIKRFSVLNMLDRHLCAYFYGRISSPAAVLKILP